MAKFVLLYTAGTMPETEEETARVMKAWGDWYGSLGSAVVDPGNPFSPTAKKIASDGLVSVVPENEIATGYTILEAGSLDEAVNMAQSCPVLSDKGQINVFETFNVM